MVKFFKNNKAFSIAEVLIAITIIAVIVVIMITLIKPDDSIIKIQYYKAYDVLTTASYNIYNEAVDENMVMYKDNKLCERLSYFINNNENNNCNADYVGLSAKVFDEKNLQFIASNGMLFYMSKAIEIEDALGKHSHRIVWVDINGNRNPNTAVWKSSRPADIVAFDITDTGEVVPLGYPKIDTTYFKAKVVFPDEIKDSFEGEFYLAQKAAFGDSVYEYDALSYNFDQTSELFQDSVLKISNEHSKKLSVGQNLACANDPDEKNFSKCTIEIVK